MASFEEDGRYVGMVRVVVHTRGPRSHKGVNHWSIYLILANNEGSVRINMRSEIEDPKGIFEVTSHTYTDCNSRIAFWDFPVNGSVQVASFYGLVYAKGRHRYMMTRDDSGCRWWVYTAVGDMAQEKYLHSDAAKALWPNMLFLYSREAPPQPLDMVKGTFVPDSASE